MENIMPHNKIIDKDIRKISEHRRICKEKMACRKEELLGLNIIIMVYKWVVLKIWAYREASKEIKKMNKEESWYDV